jgi:hypothetical protein
VTVDNINAVREARAAAGGRRVWLAPSAVPLVATFAFLAGLTYYQVGVVMEKNRQSHWPHGLLGPTVNEFLHDRPDHQEVMAEKQAIAGVYRSRLHTQNSDAKRANKSPGARAADAPQ